MRFSAILAAALLLACAGCGRSPADWRAKLRDKDPFERGLAALALARIAPADCAPALPNLLALVEGGDDPLASAARAELAHLAPHQVPLLIDHLANVAPENVDVRSALREALIAAGADAVEPLRAHLLDSGPNTSRELGLILADIGPSAVAPLIEDLADANPRRRLCAAWILARIGRKAGSAAPALALLLEHDDQPVARQAALALAEVAPLEESTRLTLEQALERRGTELAEPVREALARLALTRVRFGLRKDIGARLFSLGQDAFLPALDACGSDLPLLRSVGLRHLQLRYAALAFGLPHGLPQAPRPPDLLQAGLDDFKDPAARASAALEIAMLGARGQRFLQPLAIHFRDHHPGVALCAQLALLQIVRSIALERARRRP